MLRCEKCKHIDVSAEKYPCSECDYNVNDLFEPKNQTNADRIRHMSDEELAELLYSFQNLEDKVKFCKNKDVCNDILDDGKEIPDNMCKECLIKWLQSEEEE